MSKADELFKSLRYEKEENLELDYIKYTKQIWKEEYQDIVFDLKHNLINTVREDRGLYRTITSILNIQELQAINQKVKELGWND